MSCCQRPSSTSGCIPADHVPAEFVTLGQVLHVEHGRWIVMPDYIYDTGDSDIHLPETRRLTETMLDTFNKQGFLKPLTSLIFNEQHFQDKLPADVRDKILAHRSAERINPRIESALRAARRLHVGVPYKPMSDIPPEAPPKPEIHHMTECEQAWIRLTYMMLQPRSMTSGPYQINRINDPRVVQNAAELKVLWRPVSLWDSK